MKHNQDNGSRNPDELQAPLEWRPDELEQLPHDDIFGLAPALEDPVVVALVGLLAVRVAAIALSQPGLAAMASEWWARVAVADEMRVDAAPLEVLEVEARFDAAKVKASSQVMAGQAAAGPRWGKPPAVRWA
jgi:hypothetical protein